MKLPQTMPKVEFVIQEREGGKTLRQIELDCDFLPRVGDVFNTYDLFDDLEAEGNHFSIVWEVAWSIDGSRAVPIVKMVDERNQRLDILERHAWLPKRTPGE